MVGEIIELDSNDGVGYDILEEAEELDRRNDFIREIVQIDPELASALLYEHRNKVKVVIEKYI